MYYKIINIKMKILFIAPTYTGGIGGHAARVAEKEKQKELFIKYFGYGNSLQSRSSITLD